MSRHPRTDGAGNAGQQRIDIRIHRIQPWRNEHARRQRTHLVYVVNNLRMPDVFQTRRSPRLRQRENVPVAIVVVAHVVVVNLRRRGTVE